MLTPYIFLYRIINSISTFINTERQRLYFFNSKSVILDNDPRQLCLCNKFFTLDRSFQKKRRKNTSCQKKEGDFCAETFKNVAPFLFILCSFGSHMKNNCCLNNNRTHFDYQRVISQVDTRATLGKIICHIKRGRISLL